MIKPYFTRYNIFVQKWGLFLHRTTRQTFGKLGSCDAVRLHNFTSFIHMCLEEAQRLLLFISRSEEFKGEFSTFRESISG